MEYYSFKFIDIHGRDWNVWTSDYQTVKTIKSVKQEFETYILDLANKFVHDDNLEMVPLYKLVIYEIHTSRNYKTNNDHIAAKVCVLDEKRNLFYPYKIKYEHELCDAVSLISSDMQLSEDDERYEAKCMMYYKIINDYHFLPWTSFSIKRYINYDDYLTGHTPKYLMKQCYESLVINKECPTSECIFDDAYINAMKRLQKTNNIELIPPDYDTVLIEFCRLLLKYERNGIKIDDRIRSKYMKRKWMKYA